MACHLSGPNRADVPTGTPPRQPPSRRPLNDSWADQPDVRVGEGHDGVRPRRLPLPPRADRLRLRPGGGQIIAKHTGQSMEKVSKDTDRDFILTADQAVEYRAIDEIITSRGITPELALAGGS
jgi:hypothetical protein